MRGGDIRGVFDYWHKPEMYGDNEKQKQLGMLVSSDDTQLFDIQAQAMDGRYKLIDGKLRGRKVMVHSVVRRSGDNDIPEIPEDDVTLDLPVMTF